MTSVTAGLALCCAVSGRRADAVACAEALLRRRSPRRQCDRAKANRAATAGIVTRTPRLLIVQCLVHSLHQVHDRYLAQTIEFLRDNPSGLKLEPWSKRPSTRSSIPARSVTSRPMRGAPSRVDCGRRTRTGYRSSRPERPTKPRRCCQSPTTQRPNALGLWFSAELAPGIPLSVGPVIYRLPGGWRQRCYAHPSNSNPALASAPGSGPRRPDRSEHGQLGHRDAGRRLGGSRRAIGLGGDRRLTSLRSPVEAPRHPRPPAAPRAFF